MRLRAAAQREVDAPLEQAIPVESSRTFAGLQPSTSYTFTGKARDNAGNGGASTDNVTPQVAIVYHVLVNGVVDNTAVGTTNSRVYGVVGDNVVSVIAVDAAGNKSPAASFNIFIP